MRVRSPVPITGQALFVLAAGVVLGRHYGGPSQVLYALLGLMVVPWFAGSTTNPVPLIQGIPGVCQGFGGIAILYGGHVRLHHWLHRCRFPRRVGR